MIKIIGFIFIVMLFPLDSLAHSGGTNAEGCHTNRKTGEYHCHHKKLKSPEIEKKEAVSGTGNRKVSSGDKQSGFENKNRIFQWIDDQGEIHYSKEIDNLPNARKETLNSK